MKIDVCIPTFNSGKTLALCLKAIRNYIPYNKIIICDSYSQDNTIEIAKKFNCEIHFCKGKLGAARNILIDLVSTEFFAFIDSDVIINKQWFKILINSFEKDTGAINGFALPKNFLLRNFRILILFPRVKLKLQQRGFTSNTILRKDAVKGIKLPDLKRCEDIVLQNELRKQGWKWKFAWAICTHLKSASQIVKDAMQDLFYFPRITNISLLKNILKI